MSKNKTIFDPTIFSQLSDIESSFLKILAIMYIPVAATPLAICAHRIGIDDPDTGLSFNMNSIRPHLKKMVDLGWLKFESNRYCCHQDLRDSVLKYTIEKGDFQLIAEQVIEAFPPRVDTGILSWSSIDHGIAHARLYMYLGHHNKLNQVLDSLEARYTYSEPESIINTVGFFQGMFGVPVDTELLALLDSKTFLLVCKELTYAGLSELDNISDLWALINERIESNPQTSVELQKNGDVREFYSILSGRKEIFCDKPKNNGMEKVYWTIANSVRQLINTESDPSHNEKTNIDLCIAQYEKGITLYRQLNGLKTQTTLLDSELEKFYLLALLAKGDSKSQSKAKHFLEKIELDIDYTLFSSYNQALISGLFNFTIEPLHLHENTFTSLFYSIITFWLNQALSKDDLEIIENQYQRTKENGYAWLAAEYATALAHLSLDEAMRDQYQALAQQQHLKLYPFPFLS